MRNWCQHSCASKSTGCAGHVGSGNQTERDRYVVVVSDSLRPAFAHCIRQSRITDRKRPELWQRMPVQYNVPFIRQAE